MDKLHRFFDLYYFRIKGSSQRSNELPAAELRGIIVIKAYREALAFFLDKEAILLLPVLNSKHESKGGARGRKKEGGAIPDNTNLHPPLLEPPAAS